PTAWKAVTLPLSYSRPRVSLNFADSPLRRGKPAFLCLRALRCAFGLLEKPSPEHALLLAIQRRMVARGGFEPPKPLGRQIYSLLRLTAPQPRRFPCCALSCSQPPAAASLLLQEGASLVSYLNYDVYRRYLWQTWRPATLELAEGFEPPTG